MLYLLTYDGDSEFVEAAAMYTAIILWRNHHGHESDVEPDTVYRLSDLGDDPVIRKEATQGPAAD